MNISKILIGSALTACVVLPALASAQSGQVAWAEVLDAEPVRQNVRIPVREQVCRDVEVYYERPVRRSAAPRIFGAIVGGVIGNQFGGGSGKELMTAAGAALGSSVAADQQRLRNPDRFERATERRCEQATTFRLEERVIAWDVTYRYGGEIYQARLSDAPADRIRVHVDVMPVGD